MYVFPSRHPPTCYTKPNGSVSKYYNQIEILKQILNYRTINFNSIKGNCTYLDYVYMRTSGTRALRNTYIGEPNEKLTKQCSKTLKTWQNRTWQNNRKKRIRRNRTVGKQCGDKQNSEKWKYLFLFTVLFCLCFCANRFLRVLFVFCCLFTQFCFFTVLYFSLLCFVTILFFRSFVSSCSIFSVLFIIFCLIRSPLRNVITY